MHPVYTAILHPVLSITTQSGHPDFSSPVQRNRNVLKALQGAYSYATYLAVVPHVLTVTLVLGSHLLPSLFSSKAQAAFDPLSILRPVSFWAQPAVVTTSVSSGVLAFLQWDEISAVMSILVWAFALNRQSLSREANGSSFVYAIFKTVMMIIIGGPAAAAIMLIKERDQAVLELPDILEQEKKDA